MAVLASSEVAVRLHIGVAAAVPGFMLLALLASWKAGFWSATLVTLASTICLDYFFTEPKFSLSINSYQDVLALTSFAGFSLLVSHMVQRIRSTGLRVQAREREQSELLELSQSILISDWKGAPEAQLCHTIREQLRLRGVAFWDDRSSRFWFDGDAADAKESLIASLRAQTDYDLLSREEHIRVLRFGSRSVGCVVFRGSHGTPIFLSAVAALIASNLERVRAMRAEMVAESVVVSERLRTAVLDGLAHSVKTPLTTIAISASGLLEMGSLNPLQQKFARTIEEQALSISHLTTKLLRTARLDDNDLHLRKRSVDLRELYESALSELPEQLRRDRLTASFPSGGIHVQSDSEVLRMALVQILENGLQYSPAESSVSVVATCTEDEVHLSVHNDGTFIPVEERLLIFERYYRSRSTEHKAPGTGLGLSIAKRAVEMHQGALHVQSSKECGTTFQIALPKGEPC